MIITPTSLSINQLFGSGNEQYIIPSYQRRYSWHERQVWDLIEDISLIENSDTHLLGSIVCLTGHHTAGINQLELVDGQQRLTTISIILECIKQRLEFEQEIEESSELTRLLVSKALGGKAQRKVHLDSIDSDEFELLINSKRENEEESENTRLFNTFKIVREWVEDKSLEELSLFAYRLKNQAIIIRLDVSEAKDAFKLFETINNRGLRLSPTDIVKNFLLGNAARFGEAALEKARKSWSDLIHYLDGASTDAFFRYYLMSLLKIRVTASDVVPKFKEIFMIQVTQATSLPERHLYINEETTFDDELLPEDLDPDSDREMEESQDTIKIDFDVFLEKLVKSAKTYGELVLVKTGNKNIDRHLRNLKMIKANQTYGFLMHLLVGDCDVKNFKEVLKLTEDFVLRRHVCRERANDTESLFAKLCGVDAKEPIQDTKKAYRELCPTDEKFKDEFSNANFTSTVIDRARYCLEQFELHNHGEFEELYVLGAEDVHVEHIIPIKIKTKKAINELGDWVKYLGANSLEKHYKYVHRIGNLTLFSGVLNIGASNNPFSRKKNAYKESAITLTKKLVDYKKFKFKDVDNRSDELAVLAVKLWPMP